MDNYTDIELSNLSSTLGSGLGQQFNPDFGNKKEPESSSKDDLQERQARATEKLAEVTERKETKIEVILSPSKISSESQVPKLSDEQWGQALDTPVKRGSFKDPESGRFVSARKAWWKNKGKPARDRFEQKEQEAFDEALYDKWDRKIDEEENDSTEDEGYTPSFIKRPKGRKKATPKSKPAALKPTGENEDSDSSSSPAHSPVTPTSPVTPNTPLPDQPGESGLGTGLGALLMLLGKRNPYLTGALALAAPATWALKPTVGGSWEGAVSDPRQETTEYSKASAIRSRIKGETTLGDDTANMAQRMSGLAPGDADWSRATRFTAEERKWEADQKRPISLIGDVQRYREANEQFSFRRQRTKDSESRRSMPRPVDPESGMGFGNNGGRPYAGNDDNMFLLPNEVDRFGALSILPATLRSAGMNPYAPESMDSRYNKYHRPATKAHSQDHFSRDERTTNTPTEQDYTSTGMFAPMTYARDSQEDVMKWVNDADNLFNFVDKTTKVERQQMLGYYFNAISN